MLRSIVKKLPFFVWLWHVAASESVTTTSTTTSTNHQVEDAVEAAGFPCPCVPDKIVFQFDFDLGCDHPPSASDFASSSYCSIAGYPSNGSIKKVMIQDLTMGEDVELDVEEVEVWSNAQDATPVKKKTYQFTYYRSVQSPSVLWMDFHTTSSASRTPVASIDLNYSPGSMDCINPQNPVFWAGDWVYFLTVLSTVGTTDRLCGSRHDMFETVTSQ